MKFKRVSDNKLQIIISNSDLAERNLKKGDFVPYSPTAQKVFREILEEAYEECGFEIGNNAQLMIEAYPIAGDSMIINVTKVGQAPDGESAQKSPFDLFDLGRWADEAEHASEDEGEAEPLNHQRICVFEELEHAIRACKSLDAQYHGDSRLFQYHDQYYLVLDNVDDMERDCVFFLQEYGDLMNFSSSFLEEHGKLVIGDMAVLTLANL